MNIKTIILEALSLLTQTTLIGATVLGYYNGSGTLETAICTSYGERYVGINITALADDSKTIPLIQIFFDKETKLPITSTTLLDKWNAPEKQLNPEGTFKKLVSPYCPSIEDAQEKCDAPKGVFPFTDSQIETASHYSCQVWNRGHLTPLNIMRFSKDAMHSTFRCVNAAPQEPYTNQNPWKIVEAGVYKHAKSHHGYSMTGLCNYLNMKDGQTTKNGEKIPHCFWKLYCYKDGPPQSKTVKVIGFIASNELIEAHDFKAQQLIRTEKTKTPWSQNELLESVKVTREFITFAWTQAERFFIGLGDTGRRGEDVPTAQECISKMNIDFLTKLDWRKRLNTVKPALEDECDDDNDYCEEEWII